ncbi:hypothetical protein CLV62_12168 [Dysgonomonas alginatilytica]|uniref:Outer membrane protein with beta-barrel domain n=1 Tax=Dysgonomonas alginatilytica TaxID=1605892 RepID=A0A2V3PNF0_9BACT|nr:hypothetical protein [Dysgonomonas alginatilytica]PXV62245.1 hypothetical protein CLV62_12168 [Dysgonomonas alginatilytica]
MKKLIILSIFCLGISMSYADNTTSTQDTVIRTVTIVSETNPSTGAVRTTTTKTEKIIQAKVENSGSNVIFDGSSYNIIFSWKKKKKLQPHWTGIGMGFMNYNDKDIPNGRLQVSRSHNFTVNLIDYHKQIKNSNWLFVSGIGFEWSRYHFQDNAALTRIDGVTRFEPAPEGINYNSSKLLVYYITFPLLLEYQTSGIHMSGGVVAFFKYYSKSQVNYYTERGRQVINMGRDLNIRPVDIKLRLQVGINDVHVYGYYSPMSMFNKDRGPDLRTYTIGVMIGI